MDLYREIVSSFFKEYKVPDNQNLQNELTVPDEQVEENVPIPISKIAAGHNHLIIREIATYLSISDLKTLRLVSHHWNNNFSDAYFRASKVALKSLARMIKYIAEIERFVHSKFDVEMQSIHGVAVNIELLQPFFGKYGHQILKLQFTIGMKTDGIEDLQGWMGLLRTLKNVKELEITWNFWGYLPPPPFAIPVLPSLQTMVIDICEDDNTIFPEPAPIIELNGIAASLANCVLTMAPNLKSLEVWHIDHPDRDFRQDFYRNFAENAVLMTPPLLQDLFLFPDEASFGFILRLPIILTQLKITVQMLGSSVYDQLYKLLQTHKDTLQYMLLDVQQVNVQPEGHKILLRLPEKFPNLEDLLLRFNDGLDLNQQQWDNVQFSMPPIMNYSERFPKLETIWVRIAPCRYPEEFGKIVCAALFPDGGLVCNSVEEVELQFPNSYWMKLILRVKLERMFPNAEILSRKNFQDNV